MEISSLVWSLATSLDFQNYFSLSRKMFLFFLELSSCSQILPSAQFGDFAQNGSISLLVWLSKQFSSSIPTFSKVGKQRESKLSPFYFGLCFSWRGIWWVLLLTFCPLEASMYIHWDCTGIQYACKHLHCRAKQWNSSDINHLLNYAFSSQTHILFCCSQRMACGKYREDTGRSVLR